jgi:prepilin-type processing-associated H-X9-DG protein
MRPMQTYPPEYNNTWGKWDDGLVAMKYLPKKLNCPGTSLKGKSNNYYALNRLTHMYSSYDEPHSIMEHCRSKWVKPRKKILAFDGIGYDCGAIFAVWVWFPYSTNSKAVEARHSGYTNILYMDLHVDKTSMQEHPNGIRDRFSWQSTREQ